MEKFLFTDIDGVLVPGFISLDFSKYLYKKRIFPKMYYDKQTVLIGQFFNGQASLDYTVSEWLNLWGQGIKGFNSAMIGEEAKVFFKKYKKKIFPSAKKVIKKFQSNGFKVLGISAGVSDVMVPLSEHLGIDFIFASQLRKNNGNYLSEFITNFQSAFGKREFILDFAKNNNVSLEKSFAFGDSIQDIQFLSLVGKRIAVNPSPDLISFANKEGIPIVSSKDLLEKVNSLL